MTKYNYGYGESIVNKSEELGVCLWICTDLPIWYFRIYNSLWYSTATKMARVLFTEPTIMNMMEPCIWENISKDIDLLKLDKFIQDNWISLITTYNNESMGYNCDPIPENLLKPDYTKLTLTQDSLDYYF